MWRLNVRSQQRKGGKFDQNYLGTYTIAASVGKSVDLVDSQVWQYQNFTGITWWHTQRKTQEFHVSVLWIVPPPPLLDWTLLLPLGHLPPPHPPLGHPPPPPHPPIHQHHHILLWATGHCPSMSDACLYKLHSGPLNHQEYNWHFLKSFY